uniref:Uncharacterized protein n=1 Tax=Cyprinodon variegatus TaxID=28743 RepID=A0A3Q2CY55_CYPVA
MAEDHSLSDGNCSVDVAEGVELLFLAVAEHIVLLDGVQRLLFSLQLDDVGVRHDALKQQHLAVFGQHPAERVCLFVPLDPDALILVSLCSNHHVGFVQHKHSDLLGIYKFEFTAPVQHCTRCTNDYLLLQLHVLEAKLTLIPSNSID